jgi:hypothetical protein
MTMILIQTVLLPMSPKSPSNQVIVVMVVVVLFYYYLATSLTPNCK